MAYVNSSTMKTDDAGFYLQMTYNVTTDNATTYAIQVTTLRVLCNTKNPAYGNAGMWYGFNWDNITVSGSPQLKLTSATTQTSKPKSSTSSRGSGQYTTYTWTFNKTYTWSKTHATQSKSVVGQIVITSGGGIGWGAIDSDGGWYSTVSGTLTATLNVTVPVKTSYIVTLDSNGGTGVAATVTKWDSENLTLPTPTKTGYAFAGWAFAATPTVIQWHPGDPYTDNNAAALVAVWEPTISAVYITNLTAKRATSAGVLADDGTYVLIEPEWRVEGAATSSDTGDIVVSATMDSTPAYSAFERVTKSSTADLDSSSLANPPSFLASGANTNERYTVTVSVSVGGKMATRSVILPTAYFVMDVKAGGHGIAFGTPANTDYLFEVDNMDVKLGQDLSVTGAFGVTGNATIAGDLSAHDISTRNVSATGAISGASVTVTGRATVDSVQFPRVSLTGPNSFAVYVKDANGNNLWLLYFSSSGNLARQEWTGSAWGTAHYYSPNFTVGDSVSMNGYVAGGFLTSSKTQGVCSISLPQQISSAVTSVSISGSIIVRQSGLYLFGSDASTPASLSNFTKSTTINKAGGLIRLAFTGVTQASATNNDPIAVSFSTLTITFS